MKLNHRILPNGNLLLTADNEMRSTIAQSLKEKGSTDVWYESVVSPFRDSGEFDAVPPENIGALTSAPILSDCAGYDDDGNYYVENVWWYPNYAIADPCEDLARRGRTVFQKGD